MWDNSVSIGKRTQYAQRQQKASSLSLENGEAVNITAYPLVTVRQNDWGDDSVKLGEL